MVVQLTSTIHLPLHMAIFPGNRVATLIMRKWCVLAIFWVFESIFAKDQSSCGPTPRKWELPLTSLLGDHAVTVRPRWFLQPQFSIRSAFQTFPTRYLNDWLDLVDYSRSPVILLRALLPCGIPLHSLHFSDLTGYFSFQKRQNRCKAIKRKIWESFEMIYSKLGHWKAGSFDMSEFFVHDLKRTKLFSPFEGLVILLHGSLSFWWRANELRACWKWSIRRRGWKLNLHKFERWELKQMWGSLWCSKNAGINYAKKSIVGTCT